MIFVTVEQATIKSWAKENKVTYGEDIVNNEDLKMHVMQDILKIAKENRFNSLEKPKQIQLIFEPWTPEMDVLTPTLKLKRNVARTIYADEIAKMYEAGPMKM